MKQTTSTPEGQDAELWAEVQKERQQRLIAKLLYGENRQGIDPEEAMMMGDTVLNRSQQRGKSIEEILNQPEQYHPFNPEDPNNAVISSFEPGHPEWEQYYQLAGQVLDPARKRSEAVYYSLGKPKFKMEILGRKGKHLFGKDQK